MLVIGKKNMIDWLIDWCLTLAVFKLYLGVIKRIRNIFSALRNGWKIISPSKSFVVYAATATEKSQWMSHIRKCVNDLLLKSKFCQGLNCKVCYYSIL